jgi:hypothetical protein
MGNNFATGSTLYQNFIAERDEILKHKWLESEKAGHDIGWEKSLVDWVFNHRGEWQKSKHNFKYNTKEIIQDRD